MTKQEMREFNVLCKMHDEFLRTLTHNDTSLSILILLKTFSELTPHYLDKNLNLH